MTLSSERYKKILIFAIWLFW